jgi:lipopolysaccharide transport system ATP-binding protein
MYVRLAFSVAAHLEPEILLVDEVLAVGDIAFQKKCLGKMDSVSRQGRTVVFVSHNMNALQRLCPESMLLKLGKLITHGDTADVIEQYLSSTSTAMAPSNWIDLSDLSRDGTGKVRITAMSYSSVNEAVGYQPFSNGPLEVSLDINSDSSRSVDSIAVTLYDRYGTKLVNADTLSLGEPISLREGQNQVRVRIESLYLNPGIYTLGLWVANPPSEVYDSIPSAIMIEVIELESEKIRVKKDGLVMCKLELLGVS